MATIIQKLAIRCKARAEALEYKGKARDRFALDYFVGAATAAEILGKQEEADWIARVTMMLIATRGYSEVVSIANGAKRKTGEAA